MSSSCRVHYSTHQLIVIFNFVVDLLLSCYCFQNILCNNGQQLWPPTGGDGEGVGEREGVGEGEGGVEGKGVEVGG